MEDNNFFLLLLKGSLLLLTVNLLSVNARR